MIKDKDEYLEKTTTAFEVIIEDLKNNIENLNENIDYLHQCKRSFEDVFE